MCSRQAGRMEPHGQDLQDCKNHAADSVARFVSSKTFLSFCLVAFGAVCLDQGLEFSKILDNAVDVPLYEFFANRKPAFQKSLAEHVLGLQEPGEAGVKWHGVGTVWLKRLAQRSVLCEKILSLVSVGRVLSNGPSTPFVCSLVHAAGVRMATAEGSPASRSSSSFPTSAAARVWRATPPPCCS